MFTKAEFLSIRTAYTRHVLAAHRGGFKPMTLGQFVCRVLFAVPLFTR